MGQSALIHCDMPCTCSDWWQLCGVWFCNNCTYIPRSGDLQK